MKFGFVAKHRSLEKGLIDYLFISTHSQLLHQSTASRLTRFGSRVEVSADYENDTTSCDGFVFASSNNTQTLFNRFPVLGRTKTATKAGWI